MRIILKIIITATLFIACKTEKKATIKTTNSNPIIALTADAETTPVTSYDDAADDPCVWINPKDVSKSTIIGTNKKEGLEVYSLEGERLYSYKIGRVNNVDIRNGFVLNNETVSVVTASNRTHNTISILIVKSTGELEEVSARPITSNLNEVYGLGMYKSKETSKIYVFLVGKEGGIEQWELFENNSKIDAKLVRSFALKSQGEGIVADDFYAKVYIGEEETALWKFNAEPDTSIDATEVISTKDKNMHPDFEGVTLYDSGNGKGYIILSSQGNNSYAVIDRVSNKYLHSFSLKDSIIDGTYDTDGIDVTSVNLGAKYPKGIFIAQDGANTQNKDSLHQNFKIVDWRKISKNLTLD
ncbi:phytase [Tenacibaculum aiptasiae]|uniref:phytase n=1 Tax=Tenacibaculum aiptasiae TaxID=426481 RepID=UPI003B5D0195